MNVSDDYEINIYPYQRGILHIEELRSYDVVINAYNIEKMQTIFQIELIFTILLDNNILNEQTVTIGV
jgi:hypothetical protein